jgi:hypothetical protein
MSIFIYVRVAADRVRCDQDRVTVRRTLRHIFDTNVAVGARPVFDHDLLAKGAGQTAANDTCSHIS